MAAAANYKSRFIESYDDKSLTWLEKRLDYLEHQELHSAGKSHSAPRRADIRALRLLVRDRKQLAATPLVPSIPLASAAAAPVKVAA